jgi:pyridoxamine 5'-phosphate oxidase
MFSFEGQEKAMGQIRDFINGDRRDFINTSLEGATLDPDPLKQFEVWMQRAKEQEVKEPYAMCLSTVDESGYPDSRILFLRDIIDGALVFYTNYDSAKGQQLDSEGRAALNFHWSEQDRQVRLQGDVIKVTSAISDAYFAQRPRASQIGAWVSNQSKSSTQQESIESRKKQFEERFEGQNVPRPEHWGGYALKAHRWEFWQGRSSRLHDRYVYLQDGEGQWVIEQLDP